MLEVLRHQDLEGVLATVVRYYGGINLGAGGLVRAYTDSIAQALLGATKVPILKFQRMACAFPYALEGLFRHRMEQMGITLIQMERSMEIRMLIEAPEPSIQQFISALSEAGQGKILWKSI
jgi:putative IMPACT (imprinted ancient) family translation regulator